MLSFSDIMYFCKTFFMFWRERGVSEEGLMGQGNIYIDDRAGL